MKSISGAFSRQSGLIWTCGPTKAILMSGFAALIARANATSFAKPTVEVNKTRKSYSRAISTVCSGVMPCGGASSSRLPGNIPAGYVSQTGYQYEAISRVAGQRELAPPSKFLKLGGFNRSVFIIFLVYRWQSVLRTLRYSKNASTVGATC